MTWASPLLLFLLPLTGILLVLVGVLRHYRLQRVRRLIPDAVRSRMTVGPGGSRTLPRQLLAGMGLLLVTLSLARPQWGYTWRDVERRGLEIMVVLDTSNSMRANDITPNRLQRAKWGIEEMLGLLGGDAVGLVGFAGEAALLCPLTLDTRAFMMHLDDVHPGIIPRGGSDLEKGLRKALEGFGEDTGEADRVILLISDGEDHGGNLGPITRELRDQNIRVFAIGIGDPEGALIPLPMDQGGPYLRNRQGEVVMSRLDEATLLRLTRQTNGLYVRASQQDFGVRHILEQGLAPLKRAQLEGTRVREWEERYQLFLGLGVLLLFLEGFARVPHLFVRKETA